ncbi:hypothetical protein Ahy_A08g040279 isoform B [Arachis hypogaea]|uniref:Uncharacterized protein n=1 Tax=Arachis hypogaea TaxID=3818 RepID=A0A445BYT1_ARAHY|nr:hypothetical protein Ahy_A08g040279 isoform B [Arachis hypogaea]
MLVFRFPLDDFCLKIPVFMQKLFSGTKRRHVVMLKFLSHLALINHQIFYLSLMSIKKLQLLREQVWRLSFQFDPEMDPSLKIMDSRQSNHFRRSK